MYILQDVFEWSKLFSAQTSFRAAYTPPACAYISDGKSLFPMLQLSITNHYYVTVGKCVGGLKGNSML